MSTLARLLRDQRGVALPLAMFSLVILSVMLLAFLSMAAMEPQVSANLGDTTRARFVAEAGVEWAFDTLVGVDWDVTLANAAVGCAANPNGCRLGAANQTLPGLALADGTYTVLVRNDNLVNDNIRTGLATIDDGPGAGPTADRNGRLFLTVAGTFNGVTRTVQVVIKRPPAQTFPAALNIPGFQADMLLNTERFRVDGRDYRNSSFDGFSVNPGSGAVEGVPTGLGSAKLGIGVAPGNQANLLGPPTSYEKHVQDAFDTSNKEGRVKGKHESNSSIVTAACPGGSCSSNSDNTIGTSSALTPNTMSNYVSSLAGLSTLQVFQSTQTCPMRLDATGTQNIAQLRNNGGSLGSSSSPSGGCPVNQNINLGSVTDPKVVYFRGDPDSSSSFAGLTMNGTIKGAGLLIIEDGDFRQNGNFTWDGLVIVTGQYVSIGMFSGSTTHVTGAMTALETQGGEAGGFFEFLAGSGGDINSAAFRNSSSNIAMVATMLLRREFQSLSNWREF